MFHTFSSLYPPLSMRRWNIPKFLPSLPLAARHGFPLSLALWPFAGRLGFPGTPFFSNSFVIEREIGLPASRRSSRSARRRFASPPCVSVLAGDIQVTSYQVTRALLTGLVCLWEGRGVIRFPWRTMWYWMVMWRGEWNVSTFYVSVA
jgi:hypothetical protein